VGSNSRYDRVRPVDDREAAEARALSTMGELVRRRAVLVLDGPSLGQLAQNEMAIELNAGRPVPIGVRRAVCGLANALRVSTDLRTDPRAAEPPAYGAVAPSS
jgi:hypothetical protein